MHWLALCPLESERSAWALRALRFTPRVAWVEDPHWGAALVLEVSLSHRLWGGPQRLQRRLFGRNMPDAGVEWSSSATSLIAIALLRLKLQARQKERQSKGRSAAPEPLPQSLPQALPLITLSAAQPHLATLARMGCSTWGDLRALPRAGLARRFGAALVDALDAAWGERPEAYPWITLPERFDHKLELPALATSTPELLWAAQRLLALLQAWLRARQQGLLALELEWTLDLKRHNGVALPPTQSIVIRTAQPTQGMAHLRRLVAEHLADPKRSNLAAPANALRLRSLETAPWAGASTSLLVEERSQGERLHELVERLCARLGPGQVLVPVPQADHRPECMQRWVSAQGAAEQQSHAVGKRGGPITTTADTLYPSWLLSEPLPLQVLRHVPQFHGPLQRLTRAQRIEAGWWSGAAQPLAQRDYYIARSEQAGLLWIYRERPSPEQDAVRWFLHGVFA